MLQVSFFSFKNLPTALFIVQKVENLLAMNIKVIIFFPSSRGPRQAKHGLCCYCIASVSTDTAVAVLRNRFADIANKHVALVPPPSGWRLKMLPGTSQGFCLFSSLCFFPSPFSFFFLMITVSLDSAVIFPLGFRFLIGSFVCRKCEEAQGWGRLKSHRKKVLSDLSGGRNSPPCPSLNLCDYAFI